VFTSPERGPLRHGLFVRRQFKPALAKAVKANKLPAEKAALRFHDLRHSCAAPLIAEGAHPKLIQVRLGHTSITVTLDRYGHLSPSLEAALADKLDAVFAAGSSPCARVSQLRTP
jgi:integrase